MKLYTRTGDDGTTALFGGQRVPKDHARLDAYGSVDELNSHLGLLRALATPALVPAHLWDQLQGDCFVLGAYLATPPGQQDRLQGQLMAPLWDSEAFEADIDRLTELAPPLTSFVLPGGTDAAAQAHVARTVCRRVERLVVALARQEPVPEAVLVHLNRLSDWLFALARAENATARRPDIPWNAPDPRI